jgi:hypothetical protein
MNRDFDVAIERDSEGYYVASVPGLAGCHTQAKSLDVLMGLSGTVYSTARQLRLCCREPLHRGSSGYCHRGSRH